MNAAFRLQEMKDCMLKIAPFKFQNGRELALEEGDHETQRSSFSTGIARIDANRP